MQLGWWFSRSDGYFNGHDVSTCDKGLSESFSVVEQAFREQVDEIRNNCYDLINID